MNRVLLHLLFLGTVVGTLAANPAQDVPDFNTVVRPILSQHCFKCHGPDEKARKGKLRLDLPAEALKPAKSGEPAIVPGDTEKSELVIRIFSHDEEETMPPPAAKKELNEEEKLVLKRWIQAGAVYKPHWAFTKPQQMSPPAGADPSGRHPIDAFVQARRAKEKLTPSEPADRFTLIRRVSLDLVGMPPSSEEALQFANDSDPQAYEKLVDRLLGSPRYGERWARKWLDLARYADTNGYEKDRGRSIWPYRDWVINALNADMPFDQFTIEQIAGDMLPNPTPSQLIATGFHRNTMLNEEGGIDPLEFRFNSITDRVATTGKTWLGLTIGCAQCHTHKYDPITHREYYQVMAFFNNAEEPDYRIPAPDFEARKSRIEAKLGKLVADLPNQFVPESWILPASSQLMTASGQQPKTLPGGGWVLPEPSPPTDTYSLTLTTTQENLTSLRLDALPDPKLSKGGPGRSKTGNFVLNELSILAAPLAGPGAPQPVPIASAQADFSQEGFDVSGAIDADPNTGWAVATLDKNSNVARSATFSFQTPVHIKGGIKLTVTLVQTYGDGHTLGSFRVRLPGAKTELKGRALAESKFAQWLGESSTAINHWSVQHPVEVKSNLPLLTILKDDSVLASGDQTKADAYTVKLQPDTRPITAVRLEVLPDESLPNHGPGRTYYEGPKGDFNLSNFTVQVAGKPLKIASATATINEKEAATAIDENLQSGWSTKGVYGKANNIVFGLAEPVAANGGLVVEMHFERYHAAALGRFRISTTTDPGPVQARNIPPEIESLLLLPESRRSAAQRTQLWDFFLSTAPELAAANTEIERLRASIFAGNDTLVMSERPANNPRPTFIHNRGEYLQTTDPVSPGVLSVLNPLPQGAKPDRLAFARWLVSSENPLTARVTVNRQWAAFFGRGLVKTVDDFGFQGDPASHPELLDWLAVEFVREGWSLKKLHRLIVTSATYRQNSAATPELLAKDPLNILLARGPRCRLDAEQIRDSLLSVSGLLSDRLGGPSVYPPQPNGVQEAAYGSSSWPTSQGPDRYRRALYTFSKRTAPYAMFNTFDGPVGDVCIAQRDVSNSPLQALTMLNDTVVMEASQALGTLIAALPQPDPLRLQSLFQRCLSRSPTEQESQALLGFFQTQRERCNSKPPEAQALAGPGKGSDADRAAWTAVARILFNLDEALTKS